MEENPFKKPDHETSSGIWAGTVRSGVFRSVVYSLLAFSVVLLGTGKGKSGREPALICLAGAGAFALIGYLSHRLKQKAADLNPSTPPASPCCPPESAGRSSCDPASITRGRRRLLGVADVAARLGGAADLAGQQHRQLGQLAHPIRGWS